MSIKITLSEEEIKAHPNDSELGELVRDRLREEIKKARMYDNDNERFAMSVAPDGTVMQIFRPWTCSVCGKDTSKVEADYVIGYDHLECHLSENSTTDKKDVCVICGKETPYPKFTNIYDRIGYVEGGGQGCFQPTICGK